MERKKLMEAMGDPSAILLGKDRSDEIQAMAVENLQVGELQGDDVATGGKFD